MKAVKGLFLLLIGLSIQAHAADLQMVKDVIAYKMDGILSDTVNEGEGSAYVARDENDNGKVDCTVRTSKSQSNKQVYFCSVEFDVKLGEYYDTETRTCRLVYMITDGDLKTLQADPHLQRDCIENLASE